MSIINEALKKTQTKLELANPSRNNAQKEEKNIVLWVATVLIFIGFLGCTLAFIFLISSRNQSIATLPKEENKEYNLEIEKQKLLSFVPKKSKQNSPGILVLNGIITMGNEQFALINNEIYKAGDYVEGRRILSISSNKVEIFYKGNTFTLKTK